MFNRGFIEHSNKVIYKTENKVYFKPHPCLQKYVSHYAISFSPQDINTKNNSDDLTIIPDGSGCFYYRLNNHQISNGCWGPTTKIVNVKKSKPGDNESYFFIEFLPGGLHTFTRMSLKELRDKRCLISDINQNLEKDLLDAILGLKDSDKLINRVDEILIKKIDGKHNNWLTLYSVLRRIKESNGNVSVRDLAIREYISERNLGRLFNRNIGINVKTYQRLYKINKLIKMIKNHKMNNFTYLSQALGYYDQSHLIRDLKDICFMTPKVISKSHDYYSETFKF